MPQETNSSRTSYLTLKAEVAALRKENARLEEDLESRRRLGCIDRDRIAKLEAHVAALVAALDEVEDYMAHGASCLADVSHDPAKNRPCTCGLVNLRPHVRKLLDALDLARLTTIEQARDAVIEAARRLDHATHTKAPTSEIARLSLDLTTALRALDAARQPVPESVDISTPDWT